MSDGNNSLEMAKADSVFDQKHAEIREGARSDIAGWERLVRKINAAADTRKACRKTEWTNEEMYKLVRLADLAGMYVTGKLLDRNI